MSREQIEHRLEAADALLSRIRDELGWSRDWWAPGEGADDLATETIRALRDARASSAAKISPKANED